MNTEQKTTAPTAETINITFDASGNPEVDRSGDFSTPSEAAPESTPPKTDTPTKEDTEGGEEDDKCENCGERHASIPEILFGSFLRTQHRSPPKGSRPANDGPWSRYSKGPSKTRPTITGDADDEATQLVVKYMNVVDSVYELIGVVDNFSEKVPKGKENSLDTPVQYREALFLINDLKKLVVSIINTRRNMNTLSDIRKEYGTITAFNQLPARQQREWFERSTVPTISLMDLLSVLAGAQ